MSAGQAVEVTQHLGARLTQLEVDLAARAELAQEEEEADPEKETAVVAHPLRIAKVGEGVEPTVEVGEEVADGADQDRSDPQSRPAFRFWVWT